VPVTVSVTGPAPWFRDCWEVGTEIFCGLGASNRNATGSDAAAPLTTVTVAVPPLVKRLEGTFALTVGTLEGLENFVVRV